MPVRPSLRPEADFDPLEGSPVVRRSSVPIAKSYSPSFTGLQSGGLALVLCLLVIVGSSLNSNRDNPLSWRASVQR